MGPRGAAAKAKECVKAGARTDGNEKADVGIKLVVGDGIPFVRAEEKVLRLVLIGRCRGEDGRVTVGAPG